MRVIFAGTDLIKGPIAGGQNRPKLCDKLGKEFEINLLLTVAQRFSRMRMHLDQESVRAEGDRAAAKDFNQFCSSTALAWIDNYRQMRLSFRNRDRREIERVARIGFECSDAAFAQKHVRIAVRQDV